MNSNWPAEPMRINPLGELLKEVKLPKQWGNLKIVFTDEVLGIALQQMIEKKTKQLLNAPASFNVDDVRAFEAVNRWISEVSGDQ